MSEIGTVIVQLAKLLPGLDLGLRPGQPVFVQAGKSHEAFLNLIVREPGRSGGRLVDFTADERAGSFRDFLVTDPEGGSLCLGEIALVSMDGPLGAGDTLYREILVDEKRRSHIALGEGYTNTIASGPAMSQEELRRTEVNKRSLHHHLMIGSVELDITAAAYDGRSRPVMSQGGWAFR